MEKRRLQSASEMRGGKLEDLFWEVNDHLATVLDTAGSSPPSMSLFSSGPVSHVSTHFIFHSST